MNQNIALVDLQAQKKHLGNKIEKAIERVLNHGHYIMGPEIFELEKKLGEFCGAKHVLSCSNGTDALALILMAKEIKAGDAVLVPSFTFAATAEVVAFLGATPIFIDVLPDTFNIDPNEIEKGVLTAKRLGLKARALIAVDLFGQPANYEVIEAMCEQHGLWLLADAAQSFGASFRGRAVGTMGLCTATSFYPAKPLGCYGDGGAVFTDNDELAEILRSLRVHGEGHHKYDNIRIGVNGRMDTLQVAILIEKLSIFKEEIAERQIVAARYTERLKDLVQTPTVLPDLHSVFAQYTIVVENQSRDRIKESLAAQGIPTVIYYPKPLHCQTAYRDYPRAGESTLPVSEDLANRVLSLPIHPYLQAGTQDKIIEALVAAV